MLIINSFGKNVIVKGKIVKTGDGSLVDEINKNGFEKIIAECGEDLQQEK